MSRVVDSRISLTAVLRGKPTVCTHRKATVPGAFWRGCGTPPGSETGAGFQRGNSGTWESHLSPGSYSRTRGPGDHRPWRGRGLPPDPAPVRDTTNARQQARYREARDERSDPRWVERQSERSRVPVQVGNQGPRDPLEGRRRRASRSAGRKAGRDLELTNRHPTTPADCGASRPRSRSGLDDPGLPH
jgi:hypothetical protein